MIRTRAACSLVALCLALATGCSIASEESDTTPESVGVTVEPIIGGVAASDFPEAGYVNMKNAAGQSYLCSATLVAPRVVLTAGHCVDGFTQWDFVAGGALRSSKSAITYDWKENGAQTVNPAHHDVGLVFLDQPITLAAYPKIATAPLADSSKVVDVGRVLNGSPTSSVFKATTTVKNASAVGYPFDYYGPVVIQPGDSGGPVFADGTHTIVAVNSGASTSVQVLARTDLLSAWIAQQIAAHGAPAPAPVADAGTDAKAEGGAAGDAGAAADAKAPDAGSAAPAPACVAEIEPNATLAAANTLGDATCAALTAGDVDFYKFTTSTAAYTLALTTTDDAVFALGLVSGTSCLPVATGQRNVRVSVTGTATLCITVTSPAKRAQSYKLTKTRS